MEGGTQLRDLTQMQAAFVIEFTSGQGCIGKNREAAVKAGYSEATAHEIARQLLAKPHIQTAIAEAHRRAISGEISSLAVNVIKELLDGTIPCAPGTRLEAAKTALDRAGIVAKAETAEKNKQIKDMSPTELVGVMRQAAEARAQLEAKLKDVTPNHAQIEGEAVAVVEAEG